MDVLEAILTRRSIRRFRELDIEDEKVKALKEALIWAPSAGNLQKRLFLFVFNGEVRTKLSQAAFGQNSITEAPLVVVGCSDASIADRYGARGAELYSVQDVACSIENMMLLAWSMGLGSVWVGAFDEKKVSDCLSLPPALRPLAMVPVGYPAGVPTAPERVPPFKAAVEIR